MLTEKESKLQRKCQKIIKDYGAYVFKNNGNMFTEKGRPDLVACVPVTLQRLFELFGNGRELDQIKVGFFIGLELKRDGMLNDVSEAQEIVGEKISNAGGLWLALDDALIVEALMVKLTKDTL